MIAFQCFPGLLKKYDFMKILLFCLRSEKKKTSAVQKTAIWKILNDDRFKNIKFLGRN